MVKCYKMSHNENLIKLKELTEKICLTQEENNCSGDCKNMIKELKQIIEFQLTNLKEAKTKKEKYNCYERMCLVITDFFKKIN